MAGPSIDAFVLEQSGVHLYCFVMSSRELKKICYVTPRSEDDPDEIQRLIDPKRIKEIGEYISEPNALLPNALVVSFKDSVTVTPTGKANVSTLHFPAGEQKIAYVLDGQHRLRGFDHSGGKEMDLPVVALLGAPADLRAKVFADINSKQVRVTKTHLLSLRYQIGDTSKDEGDVMAVMTRLNGDVTSPLHNKIKMMDGQKGRWITNAALNRLMAPHITGKEAVLSAKNEAQRVAILKAYFTAVAQIWPAAWGNTKDFNLCSTLGFELILGIFGKAKYRCDLIRGKQYAVEDFVAVLQPLIDAEIDGPGGGKIRLDWIKGGRMVAIGNQAAKAVVVRELNRVLQAADEGGLS